MSTVKTIRRAFPAEGMGNIHKGLEEKSMNEKEDGWLDCIGQGKGFGLLLV